MRCYEFCAISKKINMAVGQVDKECSGVLKISIKQIENKVLLLEI